MGDLFTAPHLIFLFILFFMGPVISGLILVPPFWKIFERFGFAPALSFLMLIPLVNLILLYIVVFWERPALRQPT